MKSQMCIWMQVCDKVDTVKVWLVFKRKAARSFVVQ